MFIIKNRKVFISISIILVIASVACISFFGLNFGIDFKGGSLMEVEYQTSRPSQDFIQGIVKGLNIGDVLIQPIGDNGYSLKARNITEAERGLIVSSIGPDVVEKSFTSIGPSVGAELVRKSIISFILVSLGIIFWIAFSFRKVSKPVSSWKYGFIAIISLIHDVVIASGVFALIGHLTGAEVDTLFVVAILTILGLSVSDTIVVFDRIRENLRISQSKTFEQNIGQSIREIYPRSIITSGTIIVVLMSLVFFGPSSTKIFSIVLTVGMFFGTYSSILLASPLLVTVNNLQIKSKKKR